MPLLALDDVERARETLRRHLAPTPLRPAFCLRDHGHALLKLECWQPTGSYKVRGALTLLDSLSSGERERGLVAASAGNHALGVAYAAAALGGTIRVTLFVPTTAPRTKLAKLRTFPVEVRQVGTTYDDAHRAAQAFAKRTGATLADSVEDMLLAAGHGTLGLELLEQHGDVSAVLVPVGGGALISGVATAVKAKAPQARMIAVQAEASPALRESMRQGHALVEYAAAPTLADGLAGGIGELVFRHRHLIDDVVVVSEREIEEAMLAALIQDQVVLEGSGAVGIAALRSGRCRADGAVVVVATGSNVDASVLRRLLVAHVED